MWLGAKIIIALFMTAILNCTHLFWIRQTKRNFLTYNSTFGEADDFYATLIDENTLLLQRLYPFDGTQGVSYQTYVRK